MGVSDKPVYNDNNVVEFRTCQIRPMKQLFEGIKNKLPDTSILFSQNMMRILQVDTAQTFMVDVKLSGDNFEHYYCDTSNENGEQEYLEININAENINAAFKSWCKDDNILTFTYKRNGNAVNIIFYNPKKDETKSFELPLQHPDPGETFTELTSAMIDEYEYCMSMPTADLISICKTFKNVNCDVLQIVHDGKMLLFNSLGDAKASITRVGDSRVGSSKDEVDPEKLVFTKLPNDDHMVGPYSGKFKFSTFNEFSKSQGNGDNKIVQILLQKNKPIILHYDIGDLGEMYIAMALLAEETEED